MSSKQMAPKVADWVNANSDFIYLGAGKKFANAGAQSVLAYEKPTNHHGEGLNVLFFDGHVEWMAVDAFNKLMNPEGQRPKDGKL